jgi:hypothetical protein
MSYWQMLWSCFVFVAWAPVSLLAVVTLQRAETDLEAFLDSQPPHPRLESSDTLNNLCQFPHIVHSMDVDDHT